MSKDVEGPKNYEVDPDVMNEIGYSDLPDAANTSPDKIPEKTEDVLRSEELDESFERYQDTLRDLIRFAENSVVTSENGKHRMSLMEMVLKAAEGNNNNNDGSESSNHFVIHTLLRRLKDNEMDISLFANALEEIHLTRVKLKLITFIETEISSKEEEHEKQRKLYDDTASQTAEKKMNILEEEIKELEEELERNKIEYQVVEHKIRDFAKLIREASKDAEPKLDKSKESELENELTMILMQLSAINDQLENIIGLRAMGQGDRDLVRRLGEQFRQQQKKIDQTKDSSVDITLVEQINDQIKRHQEIMAQMPPEINL